MGFGMRPSTTLAALLLAALLLAASGKALASGSGNQTSRSFAGSNNYFLHGTSAADQEHYISTLSSWGAKVLRLWVTGTMGPCIKGSLVADIPNLEQVVGTYNDTVLERLDHTLSVMHRYGLKAIISPHDAGVLNGSNGCDAYCDKYHSSDAFYTNSTASGDYDNRLAHILEYKSPSFGGKAWGGLSEVILGFDIQNEPLIGSADLLSASASGNSTVAGEWLCGRAALIRSKTARSSIKVATGGIGGSEYCCEHEFNVLPAALECKDIDVLSVHGYMTSPAQWEYFLPSRLVSAAAAAKKHLMVEEWGVTANPAGQFGEQVAVFNNGSGMAVPWIYWQVVPGCDGSQTCGGACSSKTANGYDGYEIGLNSTKANVHSALMAANSLVAAQDWEGYVD